MEAVSIRAGQKEPQYGLKSADFGYFSQERLLFASGKV